jgi:hypothetical protein
MTSDQLRQTLRAEPFRPFVVHLADGRKLKVQHPEFVAQSPAGRTFVLWGPDEAFEVVDLLHVTSLKVTNGKTKSRKK